jgi:hypothetical protein
MHKHTYPYWTLFKSQVPDLTEPDSEGWASGSCPYCGDQDTFRVNLKSGRWVCLPKPLERSVSFLRGGEGMRATRIKQDLQSTAVRHRPYPGSLEKARSLWPERGSLGQGL